ncbi:MAG: cold shock domain-containing protein [Deltaproteobacteria bacterium]|nr:cold shock domain-containing protein [Deltaproteobacteria bacterium]
MPEGRISWFNDGKGYDFIEQEDGPNVFVNFLRYESVQELGRRKYGLAYNNLGTERASGCK